jgi:hypothetical protein
MILKNVFIALVLLVVGAYLIIIANGYKINWQAKTLQKTGMIYLKTTPQDVDVFLDGKKVSQKTPARLGNLLPKRYDIKISKDNYLSWEKNFSVESGQVAVASDIILFLAKPIINEVDESDKKLLQSTMQDNFDVKIIDSELWWGDDLITRMFEPIKSAYLFPDKKHFIFQSKKELYVVDLDGSNNKKLYDLSSEDPIKIIFLQKGKIILYQNGQDINKIRVL